jgi:hypothetical protein
MEWQFQQLSEIFETWLAQVQLPPKINLSTTRREGLRWASRGSAPTGRCSDNLKRFSYPEGEERRLNFLTILSKFP